jgi:hypothetical protein
MLMGSSSDQFLDYRKWRGNGIDQSVVFHVVTIYKVRLMQTRLTRRRAEWSNRRRSVGVLSEFGVCGRKERIVLSVLSLHHTSAPSSGSSYIQISLCNNILAKPRH